MHPGEVVQSKIFQGDDYSASVHRWRFLGRRIVFTNGCFDILHRGHFYLLTNAAAFGNILIVGLNTDDSVRKLKGSGRPVTSQENRAFALASLFYVDCVVLFGEDTPEHLIREIQPDVLVKGGDYREEDIAGAAFVKSYGGSIEIVGLLQGFSTTSLLKG